MTIIQKRRKIKNDDNVKFRFKNKKIKEKIPSGLFDIVGREDKGCGQACWSRHARL